MEGQKTETGYTDQNGDQKPQKEKDLLLPCPGIPSGGNKENLRGLEQCEKDQDQEVVAEEQTSLENKYGRKTISSVNLVMKTMTGQRGWCFLLD